MEDYKVVYKMLDSKHPWEATDWMNKKVAYKKFELLKNSGMCIWAELQYCPEDVSENDPEYEKGAKVIDQFTNRIVDVFGHKFLVPDNRQ